MAFSAHEVRVLRRALTVALRGGRDSVDFWLLGRAIGEAHDERERLRTFMTAELRRYRAALPGSAATFLSCLRNAVEEVAHVPSAEDLAALRTIVDLPCGPRERASRAALLRRCTHLAEAALEQRLTARAHRRAAAEADRATRPDPLDILIPGRPRPALNAPQPLPNPTPALTRPPNLAPAAVAGPPSPAVVEAASAKHPEPEPEVAAELPKPVAGAPVSAAHAQPKPEITAPKAPTVEPTPAECAEPESTKESESTGPEAAECASPEPATATPETPTAAATTPETPRTDSPQTAEDPVPTTPDGETPPRETLSPVIPHRRQGRVLGQLPAPEVLQTGTG